MGPKTGTTSQVSFARLALLVAALGAVRTRADLLPPGPPPPDTLRALAKSPASLKLAADFLALEQRRPNAAGRALQSRPAAAAAAAPATPPVAASGEPQWSRALGTDFRLDEFHALADIERFLEQLAAQYPSKLRLFTIGRTQERRPIRAIELTNNRSDSDYVWLDALTHAREWVTGSTMLYLLDQLVAGPEPGELPSSLHHKNYLLVPVVNPDGYHYTWTTNRMWRKNRSRSSAQGRCVGADLNRNFDHAFGLEGSSPDACSHIYSGPAPFSEPETRALAELLWALRQRVKFYLTLHSYNQLWACPYAHTLEPPPHLEQQMRVLRRIQTAVEEAEGVRYEIGPLASSLYVGSGFGIDFAYDKCAIVHSYLVELRDKGQHGFLLPPDQILPTARETLAGLRAGLRAVFGF